MNKKIRAIGAFVLVLIWITLTAFAWFSPAKESSSSERRLLAQFPDMTVKNIISGKFMSDFEKYTLDQFPGRDSFRSIKALFHTYGLFQQDNNDIYLSDGYLAKQEYPLQPAEVASATNRMNWIYKNYLEPAGSTVYCAVIPDTGYYLAEESGHLSMDYDALFLQVETALPWATHISITGDLSIADYYYTDTHWRQEKLLDVAQTLCQAMDMPAPQKDSFTATALEQPFYGVYHGQAALPVKGETMYLMQSKDMESYRVGIHNGQGFAPVGYTGVYDLEKLSSKEPYDVFLSGPQSLLRIENPNAATDRELIVFRDSFGSSLAPLLVSQYRSVTLVDTRYLDSRLLSRYLEFNRQDVLFLYSTLVLNSGSAIK